MNFTLHIWRQQNSQSKGSFQTYKVDNIDSDTSFLEMLDQLNESLITDGEDCIVFDHDCREGICGACSLVINGYPHGQKNATSTCQLYMRDYSEQNEIWVEPFRAKSFGTIKDLSVYRDAFDRIIQAGGFISSKTGSSPEANTFPVNKSDADSAFDSATCIGCGACVAVCPNSSASLFVAAKINHFDKLPQGKIESHKRAKLMVDKMEEEGFGSCSNHRHCEAVCPQGIDLSNITKMNSLIKPY
ncbi:MAG: succinate dehydrogenase/fumarate reductase iron-sulfur subunit [PS1 clade bacterium]